MEQNTKIAAKKRIFDAAVSLFARRGFAAVGIREIAKKAGVNISMINYYFDGKIGVLKDIMNACYIKYGKAINKLGDENTPLEERVKILIRNLVTFYRENTELANAAFGAIPVDIPEIIDYRIEWFENNRKAANNWFELLGFDPEYPVRMCVLRGFLDKIIGGFFMARYCCDRIAQEPDLSNHVKEHFKHDDHAVELNDSFYEKYIETLGQVYLYGVMSMSKKKGKKRSDKKRK